MKTKQITKAAAFFALFFVASNIIPPINIAGVPFTFQTLIIFMIPFIMNTKEMLLWYVTLMIIILVGIPIMSGFQGGLGVLIGPSAGFIYGWLIKMIVIKLSLVYTSSRINVIFSMFIGCLFGLLVGASWLAMYNNVDVLDNFKVILVTFLPFEIIKIFIALIIVNKVPTSMI